MVVAAAFVKPGLTPLPLQRKTAGGCCIPLSISTLISKQLECERVSVTLIPTTGTKTGWRAMSSASGARVSCNWHQDGTVVPVVMSAFSSGIVTTTSAVSKCPWVRFFSRYVFDLSGLLAEEEGLSS